MSVSATNCGAETKLEMVHATFRAPPILRTASSMREPNTLWPVGDTSRCGRAQNSSNDIDSGAALVGLPRVRQTNGSSYKGVIRKFERSEEHTSELQSLMRRSNAV